MSAAAHFEKHGYGHCDIKPANVMMNSSEPVLADFGAVTKLGETVREYTPAYSLDADTSKVTAKFDLNCITVTLVRCFLPSFDLTQSTQYGLTKFIETSIKENPELTDYGVVCLKLLQIASSTRGLEIITVL